MRLKQALISTDTGDIVFTDEMLRIQVLPSISVNASAYSTSPSSVATQPTLLDLCVDDAHQHYDSACVGWYH